MTPITDHLPSLEKLTDHLPSLEKLTDHLPSLEKLKARSVIGYGAGDFANNLAFSLSTPSCCYYYTDVAGISAAAVGTMFLVVRLWDAFADLLRRPAGRPDDDPWGKFRPFIMFGAVPLLFMSFLTFHVPGRLRRRHEADLRLRHLRRARPGLLAGQHPLRLAGLRDDPVGARAGQAGRRPRLRRRRRRRRARPSSSAP